MPQIANQDYNIVKVTSGLLPNTDAAVIVALMKAYQQGTIFDVIVEDTYPTLRRVVAADAESIGLANTDRVEEISMDRTLPQYEGLAAIQQAALAEGKVVSVLPLLKFGTEPGVLQLGSQVNEELTSFPIVDEEGHVYFVSINDSNEITAISKSTNLPDYEIWNEGKFVVPFEGVQKLIGLPISEY